MNDEDRAAAEFISTLYQTVIEHHYSVQSTASILRATCLIEAWNNK
ncbi:hypothetical protein PPHE_a1879 [Pseudoalteromonas phenolica O-BC30]|nr:hypothetical protein [Pseudoalteromonas phenolica O-BC30]